MNTQEVIDRIKEDIGEIISHFVELKQNGRYLKACCPFHGEKTPSFTVTPHRAMYKCYGCGKGGDAINFIMEHEGVEFKEAVEIGAKKLNIDFQWARDNEGYNDEDYKHKEALRLVCEKAAQYFREQLLANPVALKYLDGRGFPAEEDDTFAIGFAPDGYTNLINWAKEQGLKKNLLIDAGLVKAKDGKEYDTFRNRIMFPICNKSGRVIGFTGRSMLTDKSVPKYLNTSETDIFRKGEELFALNIARAKIKQVDRAYLVEGNLDVKRLHSIGIENTIAPCGTALTVEQARLLKLYTNKVTLIYDGDDAGRNAIQKNAEILIREQFYVSVISLPDGHDPDTVFVDTERTIQPKNKKEQPETITVAAADVFEEYNNKQSDYIIFKTFNNAARIKNPGQKSDFIKEITNLISYYEEPSIQEVYLEEVSNFIKPKKALQDQLKGWNSDKAPVETKQTTIPMTVDMNELRRWGFFIKNDCYMFPNRKGDDWVSQSNFTMTPLFFLESTVNAKRLYEVKNVHGISRIVEIPQKDMVSIGAFKVRIESLGNFLWTGSESDLNKLKAWLYEKTQSATEITQLGWNKSGFFVWGNGIYNGKFTEADQYGIVSHDKKNYYIPSASRIYASEENLFEFERKFIHIEGNITLREYANKFSKVFGDNGRIALCFYFASLFRDVIVARFDKYPVMNLFGPKGAGKNACAESLLFFFGSKQKAPNLHNTSKPALADHVATSANALCVLDEYRNDLEMEKREFLKGLWDGTGRTRMNMDKDKKKETTSVDQAVVICGQQMATADIALFSRFIVLSFTQTEYTDEQQERYDELKRINKRGLTHITHQILKCRSVFKDRYASAVEQTAEKINTMLGASRIETRIFDNWMMIMSAYTVLHDELELPWDYDDTIRIVVELMKKQNAETKKNDDLGQFWKVVEYLANSNVLFEGGDYKLEYTDTVKYRFMDNGKWKNDELKLPEARNVLYLSVSRVFSLYKRQCLQEGDKPMPDSTVSYYLQNSKAFLRETKKHSFKKIDPRTGRQEKDINEQAKRTSTTALIFDYDQLNIDIATSIDPDEDKEPATGYTKTTPVQEPTPPGKEEDDLPF